jgi:hypothetical protein
VTIDELEQLLDLNNPGSKAHWDRIVRETGIYTIALFALFKSATGDELRLAGTGTLVVVGDQHYVLSARHVWDKILRNADKLGISLREHDDHRYFLDIKAIIPSGLPKPSEWNEWGPDVVFLRIPPAHVGDITAFRVFYRLPELDKPRVEIDAIETFLLLGTPHELGTFSQTHASVQIVALPGSEQTFYEKNHLDYLDVEAQSKPPFQITTFGGFSGGGLWRVCVYINPRTGSIDSKAELRGVAFWEKDIADGKGTIRCHGRISIEAAMLEMLPSVITGNTEPAS